jgi:hypothetical protein
MNDLIELLPMTRRSFMGSILALAAAPAIVRANSLMPLYVPFDWTKYVREIVQYRIDDHSFAVRHDILMPGLGQFHVDTKLDYFGKFSLIDNATRDSLLAHHRHVAICVLEDKMMHENFSPRRLVKLPLPQGVDWARHLNS